MTTLRWLAAAAWLAAGVSADGDDDDHDHAYDAVLAIDYGPLVSAPVCLDDGGCGLFCSTGYDVDLDGSAISLTPAAEDPELTEAGPAVCDCSGVVATGTVDGVANTASGTLANGAAFTLAWDAAGELLEFTASNCTAGYTLMDGELLGKASSEFGRPLYGEDGHDESTVTATSAEPEACASAACLGCFEEYLAVVAHDVAIFEPQQQVAGCQCVNIILTFDAEDQLTGYDESGQPVVADVHDGHLDLTYGTGDDECVYHTDVTGDGVLGVGEDDGEDDGCDDDDDDHDHSHDHGHGCGDDSDDDNDDGATAMGWRLAVAAAAAWAL